VLGLVQLARAAEFWAWEFHRSPRLSIAPQLAIIILRSLVDTFPSSRMVG
jgi:hypothetical protein